MRVKEIIVNFRKEDMFDADKRRRFAQAVDDYWEVVQGSWKQASPMDRMLAEYGVDKYEEMWAQVAR